jgi:hypothetical protein
MTQTTNNYEKLYENMRQRFTVSQDNTEYTIGEYMLMKAEAQKTEKAALPVAVQTAVAKSELAMTNIVSFVDDKLTIKQAPVKDKTIRSFPFRASASAFLTASVACAFILSFAFIGLQALSTSPATTAQEESAPREVISAGYLEDNVD